jgi:hypothetical protein
VRAFDGVEVGQVEQQQPAQRAIAVDAVAASDLEPVEQGIRAVAPHRRLPF